MRYIKGNLLDSDAQALVNTVNTVGVMGKGIALQFKERFPINYSIYSDACKKGLVSVGNMLVVDESTLNGVKTIINFPTKQEWFKKSQYSYIELGLIDLAKTIKEKNIQSIAIPPLGCGNGGLKWEKVKILIDNYLGNVDCDIQIFEPDENIKKVLQAEQSGKKIKLTPARAMLLYALFKYERLGEVASLFAANKLAYFLQKTGEPLKLEFKPYYYGTYSYAVQKVLYSLNGIYLKGMEQMDIKPFEPLQLDHTKFAEIETYVKTNLSSAQAVRLDNLFRIIDGFETTLSLEILSTIHYIISDTTKLSEEEVLEKVQNWNNRKRNIIKADHVSVALEHLQNYAVKLNIQ